MNKKPGTMMMPLIAALLVGCGGGDDDDDDAGQPPAARASAEGLWEGTTSEGRSATVVILENGDTWGLYTSGNVLTGALYGRTQSTGRNLSGSGTDFDIAARTVRPTTYTGTARALQGISIRSEDGVRFAGTYNDAYDEVASTAALAGTFQGTGFSGNAGTRAVSVTVTAEGAVSMPPDAGCTASGTARPRAGGKNIFDIRITFTGATCALGNGAVTNGIAYYDSGERRLLALALNADRDDGFIFTGTK